MAYVYEVSFDIQADQMSQLEIGAPLERVIGYLRTLLPSEPGFVTSRAMYSIGVPDKTNLVIQSVWERWEDLENHKIFPWPSTKRWLNLAHISLRMS